VKHIDEHEYSSDSEENEIEMAKKLLSLKK